MRWILGVAGAAALAGTALGQVESTKVVDPETGFTFAQFVTDKGISFRVAVPDKASNASFDVVVQIASPLSVGWAGLAWGGSMTYNPLTIVWANKQTPVLSSRMAYGYYVPPAYPDAKYKVLTKGTHVNATHFQVTAQCSGCASWGDQDTGITTLDYKGQNPLAFAYSAVPPDDPSKPESSFSIHDMVGHWVHDFSQGSNANFNANVAKNA